MSNSELDTLTYYTHRTLRITIYVGKVLHRLRAPLCQTQTLTPILSNYLVFITGSHEKEKMKW
jgi:hypothetical protein